ncbi:MAG: glycosyltransferase [Candidatus Omnitrophica bacterium]|nr:glycosyltransferase [Candidatus Omnitrophota bacterium]
MKKLNVLILADTLEVYGGAERHVLDLVKNLDKNKYNLFISSLIPGGNLLKEISSHGAQVKLFPVRRIYSMFGILKGFEFTRFLRKNKIDVLMTLHFGSDIWGTIFGRMAGVPVIISNRRDMGFWKKKRHILAYRFINRYVNVIITNSNAGKDIIIKDEKVSPEKIKVIHGAVDISKFKPLHNKKKIKQLLGIDSKKIIIGAIGNFNPIKGHRYLIEAAPAIVKRIPDTHFLLVGDGPLRGNLESLAHSQNISRNITFLGSRNDIPDILSIMDICVLPSLSEGLSNALMEYMAAGKAIIATRVGGNPELIENSISGILIEPASSKDIEKAVCELVNDKENASWLANNASKKAENELAMFVMIRKYENILSERRKIGILHLISSNGFFGAEKVLLDIACFNKQNEKVVTVAALQNSHNPHKEVIEEAGKIGIETAVFDSFGKIDFRMIAQIKRYIKQKGIEIIHTHNYKSDIIGFLTTRFTKTRWVATNHVWHGTDAKLRIYEMIDGFILRFADEVVAVSDEIKADLIKKGVKPNKVKRIHNGINVTNFEFPPQVTKLKNEFGIKDKEVVITTVGRLSPEKGHAVLLEAAEKIIKEKPNTKFLIVGDGPLKDSLQSLVHRRNLEGRVIFTGLRTDISDIFSISDIYVNSSYVEGLPLTILEAMSAHLPVVATRAGATPQVISHNQNGILVDCGDAEALATGVYRLIASAEERRRLAEQASRDVRENFSIDRMGREYSDVYEEVLA